jgi:hypothetical protein
VPVLESSTIDGTTWGAATSGQDIVGRHNYTVEAAHNSRLAQNSAWLWYRYAGFGQPVMDLYTSQNYSNSTVALTSPTDTAFGYLAERQRIASVQATFLRPRIRSYSVLSLGGEIENLSYATSPTSFFAALPAFFQSARNYPALVASVGFANASRPALSISPEDGISVSASGRQRWQSGTSGASTRSVIGVSALYKSLDLPGFAHHVLAIRAAGGWADERSPNLFHAGGVSGTSLEVFPGYAVGEQRRTFGVRGYPVSAEAGIRAYSGSVEYRAPLFAPSRGFRFIPIFIDKTSLTLFGEAGRAFCPGTPVGRGVCSASNTLEAENPVMTSAGAELNLDTSLQLDLPTRLRLGVAFPLSNREILGARATAVYATFGASF